VRGREPATAWFLEAHDLALAKLAGGREKDVEFVTEALLADLVDPGRLRRGVELMPKRYREVARTRVENVIVAAGREAESA
jgi:hypothetical protein